MSDFPVSREPIVALSHWSIYEVPLHGPDAPWTRHFVGFAEDLNLPQVSSAVRSFDPKSGIGAATSGRVFQLVGESGRHEESMRMWTRWKTLNRVSPERDMTAAFYKVMQRWSGSACV